MRLPGIVGMLQLAAVLALAAPLLFFGVHSVLGERPVIGAASIAIAALMLLLPWRLTNPLDPADLAEAAVERLTRNEK